jgi:hypothetical protein
MRVYYSLYYVLFSFSASDASKCVEESATQSGAHFNLLSFLAIAFEDIAVINR